MRINGHSHVLPYPEEIPRFMSDKEIFWVDADRKFMRQKNWARPITDLSFFLDEKMVWMENNHIDHCVVLNLSQLYCNGYARQLTRDVLRFQNDFNASVQERYPQKFTGGFVVQPRYIDDALNEIDRCVTSLGLNLLCLPTHFLDENQQWKTVADPWCDPIFELANSHALAVEIHPYDGPGIIALEDKFWRFHLVWMCALTADTYHFFTLLDHPHRFPQIRTCFAHGNQFGQVNIGRRIQGYEGRPDLFKGAVHPAMNIKNENVFVDSLFHDVLSLELLIKRQGVGQLIAGIDDPYPLGEMDTVPGCYPGKLLDQAMSSGILSPQEVDQVWHSNVLRWLGKSHKFLHHD
ncbi:MAG: amidohydrolase family protein [Saprospiraceae bacterium]|nr:amidohydrolase family protein [Saprospiraceae bacterium]